MKRPMPQEIAQALLYLHVGDLKSICTALKLETKGIKLALIDRIIAFMNTGETKTLKTFPKASRSSFYRNNQPLQPHSLMLYGQYKNDAQAREFFKQLIGPQFHFTAFSIDWLKARWMAGHPPTHLEFATFWQHEYNLRKQEGSELKKEWALLNFVKAYRAQNPNAKRTEVANAWKQILAEKRDLVFHFLHQEGILDRP